MNLEEKYRLLEPVPPTVPEPEVALLARDVLTGVPVVFHLLAGSAVEALMSRLRSVPAPEALKILDVGEIAGNRCVVSQILPGNQSLVDWLNTIGIPEPVIEPAPPPASPKVAADLHPIVRGPERNAPNPVPPPKSPGVFTLMISQVLVPGAGAPESDKDLKLPWHIPQNAGTFKPAYSPPPAATPSVSPSVSPLEPGEFTRMFGNPAEAAVEPPKPEKAAPPEPPSPSPGEFTRLFSESLPKPASSPIPDPKPAEAGEFTKLFGTGAAAPPSPPIAKPVVNAPPPASSPGEFTKMLVQSEPVSPRPETPVPSANVVSPASQAAPDTNFTQLFVRPLDSELAPNGEPAQPPKPDSGILPPISRPPASSSPLNGAEAGEFTRLMQAPPVSGPAPPRYPPAGGSQSPGEFTRMLQSPFAGSGQGGGQFGRPAEPRRDDFEDMFGQRAPVANPSPGGATSVFSGPANMNTGVPMQSGPSEFTRMFEGPAKPEPLAAAPAPKTKPAAPAPDPSKNRAVLIVALGILFFAVLALILFFAIDR
jgi:hypothetical protein